jgi:heavy metal sensor kinase
MSLEKHPKFRHSVAFRLTVWYAIIFSLSALCAFLLFYWLIVNNIRRQTDQDLIKDFGIFTSLLTAKGPNAVKDMAIMEAQASGEKKIFIRMLYRNGSVFSSSNMSYWEDIGIHKDAIQAILGGNPYIWKTVTIPENRHQIRILYGAAPPGFILQLGQSMEHYTYFIDAFRRIFLSTMFAVLLLAAILGWFLAKRALAGVAAVTQTARQISHGSLDQRVPIKHNADEIDELAVTFNQMLDRIEHLVGQIKAMSDNIAHDLKSPLTRIRGGAEVTLTTATSVAEYEQMTANTIEECDRLLDLINTMLFISKTEAGVDQKEFTTVDLASAAREACVLFEPMAEEKALTLTCSAPSPCTLGGDIRMLQRMIANLLDNALKYTPPNGRIEVKVQKNAPQAIELTISDTGIGISPEEQPQIFKRFYRSDRSRSEPGAGLGLSLAKAIANAHGGHISVQSKLHRGCRFKVLLPAKIASK